MMLITSPSPIAPAKLQATPSAATVALAAKPKLQSKPKLATQGQQTAPPWWKRLPGIRVR
jgi:hypothetical protein